jgi:hypothetical protein
MLRVFKTSRHGIQKGHGRKKIVTSGIDKEENYCRSKWLLDAGGVTGG